MTKVVFIIDSSVEETNSGSEPPAGIKIHMPLGEDPGGVIRSCDGISFSTNHQPVAIFQEESEIGSGPGHDVVT